MILAFIAYCEINSVGVSFSKVFVINQASHFSISPINLISSDKQMYFWLYIDSLFHIEMISILAVFTITYRRYLNARVTETFVDS